MAPLTAKRRKALKTSVFAIPEKRAYPIDTLNRACNALAMVAAHGSEDEKKRVRAAVYRKYPQLRKTQQAARSAVRKKGGK